MNAAQFNDLVSLTKPRLSSLVILTTGAGLALTRASLPWPLILGTLVGATLVVGAANALNCWWERDVDALMSRTAQRALPQGRIAAEDALLFGLGLSLTGTLLLALTSNVLTALLGLLGVFLYVLFYTPMKRISALAVFAGAAPGAIPPMMGWTAATGRLDAEAWILFALLFVWQLPHFIAISLFRLDDYERAGLKTLPGSLGVPAARRHMSIYAAFLLLLTLLPYPLRLAGPLYLAVAAVLGLLFAALFVQHARGKLRLDWSRAVFFGSLIYLPLVLGAWVADRWIFAIDMGV